MQRKHVAPGQLIRLDWNNPTYAVTSEYSYDSKSGYDAYLLGSGEALHLDGEEWVALIDIESIELELEGEYEYPPPKKGIEHVTENPNATPPAE